jgi:hypothetical protein
MELAGLARIHPNKRATCPASFSSIRTRKYSFSIAMAGMWP